MRQLVVAAILLFIRAAQPQTEPVVRIGLDRNASTVTIRSAAPFTVEQRSTRTATFTTALAVDPAAAAAGPLKKADLQYRVTIELDDQSILVLPPGGRARVEPGGALLEVDTRAYHGALLHSAQPGAVQGRRLRRVRDGRVPGLLRRAHGGSAGDAGRHRHARRH